VGGRPNASQAQRPTNSVRKPCPLPSRLRRTRQFLQLRVKPGRARHAGSFSPAASILSAFVLQRDGGTSAGLASSLTAAFERQCYLANVFYIVLNYFFCYFWTAITSTPGHGNNLKDYGSFIRANRPASAPPTTLEKVIMAINLWWAPRSLP